MKDEMMTTINKKGCKKEKMNYISGNTTVI